ncbi:MAG TPA: hypothetical protein VF070_13165 [Streptosporangiaceae bacterium]
MPPDKPRGRSSEKAASHTNSTAAGTDHYGNRRVCDRCGKPLPARRRRFCSDLCRVRQQKAERVIEGADYAAGVRRLVRAQGRRAGTDLEMFAMFAESVDYGRARLQDAADQLIAQGYRYGDIGRVLSITRQGARQRFQRQREVAAGSAATEAVG